MEVGFMMQEKKNDDHTHKRGDASAFYSLRQHLLCVIAPSPTRFTPYILSSSHLPHLHLPLYRPLTPSLPIYFLSLSLPPFSLSSRLPSSLSSSLLASISPPLHSGSWLEVQLSRYNWRAALLLLSLSPLR